MKKIHTFFILFILAFSSPILACDCDPMLSIKESVEDADMVIHGKILKATLNKLFSKTGKTDASTSINEYEVLVVKKYKGAFKTDTIIVRTTASDCGIVFEENSEVFFYAYKAGKSTDFYSSSKLPLFWTWNCSRTDEFTKKEEEDLEKAMRSR